MAGRDDLHQAEIQQLVEEVQDIAKDVSAMNVSLERAAKRLRTLADRLDEVWYDCKVCYAVGSGLGVTGGVLTVLGGIATFMTGGAALPLAVGTGLGVAGSCANLGAIIVEAKSNSSTIRETNREVQNAIRAVEKVMKQIETLRTRKSETHLLLLGCLAVKMLGENHLVVSIIKDLLPTDLLSSVFPSVTYAARRVFEQIKRSTTTAGKEAIDNGVSVAVKEVATEAGEKIGTEVGARATGKAGSEAVPKVAGSAVTKEGSEAVGKAGAKGGAKATGAVIIGVSLVFLVWDAMDLGFAVRDIIKNKGSDAARCLREKAEEFETILRNQ